MSTITVTPTVELSHVPPRVKLDVVDSGTPAVSSTTVVRLDPDGATVTVRTPDGNPLTLATSGSTRIGVVYDYDPPYGQPVTYSTLENPATVSAAVTVDEPLIWLNHPGVPALSTPITLGVGSLAEEEWAAEQNVLWPMGRRTPVVQSDGQRKAPGGSMNIKVDSLSEMRRVRAVLDDLSPLQLNIPPSYELGVDTCYVAVLGATNARVTDIGSDPYRVIRVQYQVVERPVGGSQSERTYADLLDYATYADLLAAYPTYQALLSGP